ncbi:staygreen family protein [Clostridium botulinum]|uniref:Staygreen protein domain-containing protein n=1 Tax=Clostridium botulinum TaxID=1491 RepID=A0A9Q1ZAD0_CLOBO|nr:staygreen family protein [Clostridium botulinum]AEB76687.1 conserved hypothetical protein [Clostridium botulinum BKT015925]KEI00919.1 hypothetical protein Y848_10350 [Clostridium botulinum C/D str. Sp77]KEI04813.1 hypothetical protein Z953_03490 [Clostridium botulinum D str. 16868]KLU76843.1 hypothetical protein CBC3_01495 [Clostridium botulinum V891]KOA74216.1 hypothetical protein ADU78_11015 [Clostridium botulinum]
MKNLDPKKLSVNFQQNIPSTKPILPRRYTLTHCDEKEDLFLDIGFDYTYDKISNARDEVFAQWIELNGEHILSVDVYVGGLEFDFVNQSKRYDIFNKTLPIVLSAIRYGDSELFKAHSELDNSEVIVHFHSIYPSFNTKKFVGYINNFID